MRKPKKKHGLTQREYQVFKLRAEGFPYKAIGAQMGISEKTVCYYIKRIFTIMNCHSYADLIKRAIALGVVCLCLTGFLADGQSTQVVLSWNNYNDGSQGVILFATTNVALPTNQWPVFVYLPKPVPVASNYYEFRTNLTPANWFFVGAFTNAFWANNSFFSNTAATPQLPTNLLTGFSISNH
jgi:DNA-binding CsgD family transcriptional regulator